jgi:mycothiol synthase
MKTYLQEKLQVSLPEDFTARGARMENVGPAFELFSAWSQSVIQENDIADADAIRKEWVSPGFDPAEDIRLVFAPNGDMAGYVEVWTTVKPPVHPWMWGRVHPEYEDLGIGTWLMHWAEQRALHALDKVPDGLRFAPRVGTFRQAEKPKKLFEDSGYSHLRTSYQMRIEMNAPVLAPVWPQAITLRTFNPETDAEAVYRAEIDSFRDHFGFINEPFEEGFQRFKYFHIDDDKFDPTLWFLAMDGDEIAGINLCRSRSEAYDDPDLGWVGTLGVRRSWRKRGLGLALLRHSFNEFYRRGRHRVGLGVDAQNLTGALRLYESAGMHVHRAFDFYEKELRAGTEISVQSLSQ